MSQIGHFELPRDLAARHSMSPIQFAHLSASKPLLLIDTVASDGVNLMANPGTNQLFVQYLGLFQTGKDLTYWQTVRDERGTFYMFRQLLALDPQFVLVFLSSTIIWFALLAAATYTFIVLSIRTSSRSGSWQFVAGLIVYSLAVPFAAGSIRWTHRTPIDFVLAILSTLGASSAWSRTWRWRNASSEKR
jgi:hypothetical protein